MKCNVAAQVEFDLCVRNLLPGGRHLGDDLTLVVAGNEIVEDVAVDIVAVRIPLNLRIE